jgi:hypothetical protein
LRTKVAHAIHPDDTSTEQADVIIAVAEVLSRAVATRPSSIQPFDEFDGVEAPEMCLVDFAKVIFKYSKCSPESCILCLAYIHRFLVESPDFTLSVLNVHRLLLTSMVVAAKFLDDIHLHNSCYAKIGGVSMQELGILEVRFLKVIQWKLFLDGEDYERFKSVVEEQVGSNGDAKYPKYSRFQSHLAERRNQDGREHDCKQVQLLISCVIPPRVSVVCDIGTTMDLDAAQAKRRRCRSSSLAPAERRQRLRAHWLS